MKMSKFQYCKFYILSYLLLITLKISAYDIEVDGIFYNIDLTNRTAAVTFNTDLDSSYSGEITIPPSITYGNNIIPVVRVDEFAFSYEKNLKSVFLPNSISEISGGSFRECPRLKKVNLSNNIIKIEENTFYGCDSLEVINLPTKLQVIEEYAFYNCKSLRKLNKCDSLLMIGSHAFASCVLLEDFDFPNIQEIKSYAFQNCGSLIGPLELLNINIIGEGTFYNCFNLAEIKFSKEIEQIPQYCFYGCSKLSNFNFTNIHSIGSQSFYNCINLGVILTIKDCQLGSQVFYGCEFQTLIINDIERIPSNCFENCCIGTIIVGDGVKIIGNYAFMNNKCKEIKLGSNIKEIGNYAFQNCINVKNLTIPSSVNLIGYKFIAGCDNLNTLIIKDSDEELNIIPYLKSEKGRFNNYGYCSYSSTQQGSYSAPNYGEKIYESPFENQNLKEFYLGRKLSCVMNRNCFHDGTGSPSHSVAKYAYIVHNYITSAYVPSKQLNKLVVKCGQQPFLSSEDKSFKEIRYWTASVNSSGSTSARAEFIDSLHYSATIDPALSENLTDLILMDSNPPIIEKDFPKNVYMNAAIFIPLGSRELYENDPIWKNFWNIKEIESFEPDSIELSENIISLPIGSSYMLSAKIEPIDILSNNIEWTSEDEKIAIVSGDGKITGISIGNTIIVVKYGNIQSFCRVEVIPVEAETLTLDESIISLNIGESFQLSATIIPENTTVPTIIWCSSDNKIATVSDEGLVTALKEGETIISATCGEVSAECKVYVIEDSGVESIFENYNDAFTIYTLDGVLIQKDCNKDFLNELDKGIYIVIKGDQTIKISI